MTRGMSSEQHLPTVQPKVNERLNDDWRRRKKGKRGKKPGSSHEQSRMFRKKKIWKEMFQNSPIRNYAAAGRWVAATGNLGLYSLPVTLRRLNGLERIPEVWGWRRSVGSCGALEEPPGAACRVPGPSLPPCSAEGHVRPLLRLSRFHGPSQLRLVTPVCAWQTVFQTRP